MKKNLHLLVLGACALFTTSAFATNYQLDPLWSAPAGTGTWPFLSTNSDVRGIAYNATTDHLLVLNHTTFTINVMNATTGADTGNTLPQPILNSGGNVSFKMNLMRAADDGSIYVCNLENSVSAPQLNIYRWVDENDGNAQSVYGPLYPAPAGDSGQRYGDTMDIIGSGTNTTIIIGTRGTEVSIFRPSTSNLADQWTNQVIYLDAPAGACGFGLTLGANNTFWGAQGLTGDTSAVGNPIKAFSFFGTNATTLGTFAEPPLAAQMAPIKIMPSLNLLGGVVIKSGVDAVNLYDVSNPASTPVLLSTNVIAQPAPDIGNSVYAGALDFAPIDGSHTSVRLFALDTFNGIVAYNLTQIADVAPTIVSQPMSLFKPTNTTAVLSTGLQGSTPMGYAWYLGSTPVAGATNSVLTISNLTAGAAGSYTLVASNSIGAITSTVATITISNNLNLPTIHIYEPFNYTAGDHILNKVLGVNGMTWTTNGTGDDTLAAANSLTVPGLAASSFGAATNGGAGAAVRLNFGQGITNGTLFVSFMFRVDALGSFNSANNFIMALNQTNGDVQDARMLIRLDSANGGFDIGLNKTSTGTATNWYSGFFTAGQTIFVVGRYVFNTATTSDDTWDLWLNPDPSTFGAATPPASAVTAPALGTDAARFDQFVWRQNTAANTPQAMTLDEIRIDTTWAAVTPTNIPQPSLTITPSGTGTANVTWPLVSTGFSLESSDFSDTNNWTRTATGLISGTNYVVSNSFFTNRQYFRLKK